MLRASLIVTIISILSYLTSFISQLVMARVFGASISLDSYFVSISIPFLFLTAIGSLFSYTLIPALTRTRKDSYLHSRFASMLFCFVLMLSLLLVCLFICLAPFIINAQVPTYAIDIKMEIIFMTRLMWCASGCAIINSFLIALHHVEKKFFLPALLGILPHLFMIVLTIGWGNQLGPKSLVIGLLVGYIIMTMFLFYGLNKMLKFNKSMLSAAHELVKVAKNIPVIIVSLISLSIYGPIDAVWASRLGDGALSHLGYGQRIMMAMGNVLLIGSTTVLFPFMAETALSSNLKQLRAMLLQAMRILLFFVSMIFVIFSTLRVPFIKVLFERGAFSGADTLEVSSLIPGLSLGIAIMITVVLLLRVFYAIGKIKQAALISAAGAIVYIILSGPLSSTCGLKGLVATYFMAWFTMLILALRGIWRKHNQELINLDNVYFLVKLVLVTGCCAILTVTLESYFIRSSFGRSDIDLLLRLMGIVTLSVAAYLSISMLVRMKELSIFIKLLPTKWHLKLNRFFELDD